MIATAEMKSKKSTNNQAGKRDEWAPQITVVGAFLSAEEHTPDSLVSLSYRNTRAYAVRAIEQGKTRPFNGLNDSYGLRTGGKF
jgi:hypothetical protein